MGVLPEENCARRDSAKKLLPETKFPLEQDYLRDSPSEFEGSANDATSVLLCHKHIGAQNDR